MKNEVIKQLHGLMRSLIILIIASMLASPTVVRAGDHWLSRVTVTAPTQPDTIMSAKQASSEGLASVMTTSSTAVFDITISLDANPQGDDDWTVDDGANDADQRAYEERIKEFVNAVYQSTNGAHKIGMVTIYRDGSLANSVDVLWNENCSANAGPRANPSGFGKAGKRIWMCTNWDGSTLTDKGSGYTMAHEWGHYAYGLYDEYAQEQCAAADIAANTCHESTPRGTDTYAVPSIMGCQWKAAGSSCLNLPSYTGPDADFLEHSTENIHPHRDDSTGANAQKRVFGESAWQSITRDPATDPKFSWLPERTQYTTLTAPSDPNWIVNDDESTALSELDIRWVGDQLLDLSVDVSGSMSGTPLNNAKTGANLLIDQIQPGTALGVSSFAYNVVRNFAITDIPDPDTGVRASAKAAVNALAAGGLTSIYDGLMFSLNDLQAFDPNRTGVVYVLSDGGDNDSTATESSVISAYQAAGVPIIAFAYGSFAPTGTLLNLANSTGGAFFQSPTTLPEIQQALLSADAKLSDNILIASARASVPAGTTTWTIPIDSTLTSALINLSYNGSQTDFSFSLLRPDGTASGVTFTCKGSTSCSAMLDEAFFVANGYGDYRVQSVNNIGTPKDVTTLVSATPSGAETYDIAVGFSSSTVNYPADMAIRATVTKGGVALAGLDVVAEVTDPSGSSSDVTLFDDGTGADILADDGTYSSSIPYTANGIYSAVVTASNEAGNAQTTFEGVNISLKDDGTAPSPPVPVLVTENFSRVGTASASTAGVMIDDHNDDPTGGACTVIFDDNADSPGRIDDAGDADCFTFLPSSISDPVIVRATSLSFSMDPLLTIYNNTGTIQIAQVDLSTSENPSSGVVVTVPAADLDASGLVFVVQHIDPTATNGNYLVSAGALLTSDAVGNEPPIADPNGPYLGPLEICFDGTGSSDPEDDPLTYDWDYGEGNFGTGSTPCHAYTDAGIYEICLAVNDGLIDSEIVCTNAIIYDPSAGFATGGGWIDSPEGAYIPDASLTGKVNFGFVAKYKKGANTPTGQTEFHFQTADLNFHSDSYAWLVVTGRNYAKFKGVGTINGMGDYKFMIWAGDNDPDTFRIKIWEEDSLGIETVYYDNGFDQAIEGGSIVIHTKK